MRIISGELGGRRFSPPTNMPYTRPTTDIAKEGLFSIIRQPIYVAFALTTWTVPVWTPDQLCLAIVLTTYCLFAPRLKERRFSQRYGKRFEQYRHEVPYALPHRPRSKGSP